MNSRIIENLETVRAEIRAAALQANREPTDIKLLTVSKTRPLESILELYQYGIRDFGENREPELKLKAESLPEDICWHFIGPLQSNKIRKVIRYASVIHSVSSVDMVRRCERIAAEENRRVKILLEVNISGELSKDGLTPAELPEAAAAAAANQFAVPCGLMTMAPRNAEEDELLAIFTALKKHRDQLTEKLSLPLPELSMGMSNGFVEAIKCGSTIVRIGTRIFQ